MVNNDRIDQVILISKNSAEKLIEKINSFLCHHEIISIDYKFPTGTDTSPYYAIIRYYYF